MKVLKVFLFLIIATTVSFSAVAAGQSESSAGGVTEISLWTFQEVHQQYYEEAAERWNAENPDRPIELMAETLPYDDMHSKLLIALQSGVGAPAIVDIEISRFPNYLKGQIQLEPMNEYVEPVIDQFVRSRLDIYSKDGNFYGLPFHVGAAVMYYNVEIMEAAGVDIDAIDTWDDYVKAGLQVKEKTGKFMTTLESRDQWSFWPMISQRGSDFFDPDGSVAMDNEINISTLEFQHDMIYKYGIATTAPGGKHHAEEYYGAMNAGEYGSILMPMWYMGRFTNYMSDLKGKIAIRPLPRWEAGGNRSAGMGGTGTVVTKQAENVEMAKEFLAFAKLSEEGNEKLWSFLGFDPPRWSVWDNPVMNESNKFTEYFVNDNIFGLLLEVKDEINPVTITEKFPYATELVDNDILFQALADQTKTPAEALHDAAEKIRK